MNLNLTAKASEKNIGNRTIIAENARFRKKAVTGTKIFQARSPNKVGWMTASITLRAVRAEKLHELTHNIILYPL